jgi:hypothetical protein
MPAGRPTDYREEYAEQARKLCLLGHTDAELGTYFDVSEQTINAWKHAHPQFLESISEGKERADARVAESLYKQAIGYVGKKTVTANVAGQITDIQEVDEYVGPSATAGIFWLKNRQKAKWRDKIENEITGADGGPVRIIATALDERI